MTWSELSKEWEKNMKNILIYYRPRIAKHGGSTFPNMSGEDCWESNASFLDNNSGVLMETVPEDKL